MHSTKDSQLPIFLKVVSRLLLLGLFNPFEMHQYSGHTWGQSFHPVWWTAPPGCSEAISGEASLPISELKGLWRPVWSATKEWVLPCGCHGKTHLIPSMARRAPPFSEGSGLNYLHIAYLSFMHLPPSTLLSIASFQRSWRSKLSGSFENGLARECLANHLFKKREREKERKEHIPCQPPSVLSGLFSNLSKKKKKKQLLHWLQRMDGWEQPG